MVSARIAPLSVGSRSGAHSGECGAGTGMPLCRAAASLVGWTAPTCSSADGTPARPYSEKSSDVIFAGISTTTASPSAFFNAPARRSVSVGSLYDRRIGARRAFQPAVPAARQRRRFAFRDAANRRERARAHLVGVGADRQLQPHFVRDDVGLRAAVNRPDGDHDRVDRVVLARHDRLQRQDDARGEHDRIDRCCAASRRDRRGRRP